MYRPNFDRQHINQAGLHWTRQWRPICNSTRAKSQDEHGHWGHCLSGHDIKFSFHGMCERKSKDEIDICLTFAVNRRRWQITGVRIASSVKKSTNQIDFKCDCHPYFAMITNYRKYRILLLSIWTFEYYVLFYCVIKSPVIIYYTNKHCDEVG